MEKLIFALVASHAYRQPEPVVAQPEEFQPFDLQALRIKDQLPYIEMSSTMPRELP